MMAYIIQVENLSKSFSLNEDSLTIIDDITFSVKREERVGLIGLNGSGKSTIIKILSGIMLPNTGTVKILQYIPHKRDNSFLQKIFVLFGGISSLREDLTVQENFELEKGLYDVRESKFHNLISFFCQKIVFLNSLLTRSVKTLSLGQRIICEILTGLLHFPEILFLDEPILGLDFQTKTVIREIILQYCNKYHANLLLTSHDFSDIDRLCHRIIILNDSKIVLDTDVFSLKQRFSLYKYVEIFLNRENIDLDIKDIEILKTEPYKIFLKIPTHKVNLEKFILGLIESKDVLDFNLSNLSLEEIIKDVYQDTKTIS